MRAALALLLAGLLALVPIASLADNKAKFGFVTEITATGYFSPTLKQATVTHVVRGSPADMAGLLVGDSIIEVNGKPLAGASARRMGTEMRDIRPGQLLVLTVARADHTVHKVSIVAGSET